MSWVDLLALTLTLWTGAKGYIRGVCLSLYYLMATAVAIAAGVALHPHLFVYLNMEWRVDEVVSVLIASQAEAVSASFLHGAATISLPSLAEAVLFKIAPELAVVYVTGGEASAVLPTQLVVRFFCVAVLFVLILAFALLLIRINKQTKRELSLMERQKIVGMCIGIIHGVLISTIVCIVFDAISYFAAFRLFRHDLGSSYLYQLTEAIIQRFLL